MEEFLEFLLANKEWIFSGVGVAVLSSVIGFWVARSKKYDSERRVNLSRGNVRLQVRGNISHGFVIGNKTDKQLLADFKDLNKDLKKPNKPLKQEK